MGSHEWGHSAVGYAISVMAPTIDTEAGPHAQHRGDEPHENREPDCLGKARMFGLERLEDAVAGSARHRFNHTANTTRGCELHPHGQAGAVPTAFRPTDAVAILHSSAGRGSGRRSSHAIAYIVSACS